jgi:hypothetical protein
VQAARAYDQAALEHRGPGAVTNFPAADYYDVAGELLPKEVGGGGALGLANRLPACSARPCPRLEPPPQAGAPGCPCVAGAAEGKAALLA